MSDTFHQLSFDEENPSFFESVPSSVEADHPLFTHRRIITGSKTRDIYIPGDEARAVHEEMLAYFRGLTIDMPHATGSLPGKRLIDNVLPHRNNNFFYMVDIHDAFASVDHSYLKRRVSTSVPFNDRQQAEEFVSSWATIAGVKGLPLGLPCSPFLFNLYCYPLDCHLGRLTQKYGLVYTRYLDDLTFSSSEPLNRNVRRALLDTIEDVPGFSVNDRKSRRHSLKKGPVTITGISLYSDRHMQLAPPLVAAAKEVLKRALVKTRSGEMLSDQEIGEINGWHGTVRQLADHYSPETSTQAWLNEMYRQLGSAVRRASV